MISTPLFLFAMLLGAALASVIWSHRLHNARIDFEDQLDMMEDTIKLIDKFEELAEEEGY